MSELFSYHTESYYKDHDELPINIVGLSWQISDVSFFPLAKNSINSKLQEG